METDNSCFLLKNMDVEYAYGNRQQRVLHNISLAIAEGEKVSVLGPSGCGKSTLLKVLANLKNISAGEIFYRGRVFAKNEQSIALMLQNDGLLPWKSVLDNVKLPLILQKTPADISAQKAKEILRELGLEKTAHKYPAQLSGGQRQRAALARALISEPKVLLLDEPFSALDTFLREQMQDLLRQISKNRCFTAVLVTHSIEEAVYLGETIVIMNQYGEISRILSNKLKNEENMRQNMSFYAFCREVRLIFEECMQ